MALSTRPVVLLGGWLGLVASVMGGCRGIDICGAEGCETTGPSQLEPMDGGEGGAETLSSSGRAGEGGATDGGAGTNGGGEGGEPQVPSGETCEPDLAECDGSSLTSCETNVTWSVRHCGQCHEVCDGLCQGGRCQPAQLIHVGFARSMVVSATTGIAVADSGEDYALLHVDFKTGEPDVLLSAISYDATLAASTDRFYALDTDANLLHSVRLDGSDPQVEVASDRLQTLGATADGVYYVDYSYTEDTDVWTEQLWFRATGASSWQLLYFAPGLTILSSSQFGLLLMEYGTAGESTLFVVHGQTLNALPDAPAEPSASAVTESGAVLLIEDETTGVTKLWWQTPSEGVAYEISSPGSERLHVLNDRVALYSDDNGSAFVQHFTPAGPVLGKGGLPSGGEVVAIDSNYIWYTVWDTVVTRRFLRAKWLDLDL